MTATLNDAIANVQYENGSSPIVVQFQPSRQEIPVDSVRSVDGKIVVSVTAGAGLVGGTLSDLEAETIRALRDGTAVVQLARPDFAPGQPDAAFNPVDRAADYEPEHAKAEPLSDVVLAASEPDAEPERGNPTHSARPVRDNPQA
jgi:hypothetical protein